MWPIVARAVREMWKDKRGRNEEEEEDEDDEGDEDVDEDEAGGENLED